MKMATFFLKALVLLALVALSAAARIPDPSWQIVSDAEEGMAAKGGSSHAFEQWLTSNMRGENKHDSEAAYIAFKYYVSPDQKDRFVDLWRDLEKSAKDEKGLRIFDLKKTMSDNMMFLGYGEWKSFEDYMDHYESDYTQKFLENLRNEDIAWTITPLEHPDVTEVTPKGADRVSKKMAHVIIRYTVAPNKHDDFLDAWEDAAKATAEEKGAHIYSLRKVAFDNFQFWTYGTWASMKDFQDHFESDHVRKLRDTLDKHNVVWYLTLLRKIGDQPE